MRRQGISHNRDKWKNDNVEMKNQLTHVNGVLKSEKYQNDQRDFTHKKNMWRSVMAQKLGL